MLRILIGILASGTLFLLALPPADQGYLGWLAMAPLLWSVHNTRFIYGFVAGILTCLFSAMLAANGVFLDGSIPDGSPQWIYTGFMLFGWITGVVAGAMAELKALKASYLLGLAALAVLMELLTMVILPAHLALTQYRSDAALGMASVGGIWAVSFVVWLINICVAALALALSSRRERGIDSAVATGEPMGMSSFKALYAALPALLLFAAGAVRPHVKKDEDDGRIRVGLIQSSSTDLKVLAALNAKAGAMGAQVVVWPELSAAEIAPAGKTEELITLAKQAGQPAFATTFKDGNVPLPHNTASVFSPKGESARYFKRKPFSGERMIHLAGTEPVVVGDDYHSFGLNICFDSCYPAVMRETAALSRPDAILLPTQDPVSPNGVIQAIHAAYTPFRAAELGTAIVRADVTAHSMIVDSEGRIVSRAGSGSEEVLVREVSTQRRGTLYKSLGDWFLYVCIPLLIWAAWSLRTGVRSAKEHLRPA